MERKKIIKLSIGVLLITLTALTISNQLKTYENISIFKYNINNKILTTNSIAMYKNDGDKDTPITTMPESGYEINTEKSYCTLDNINKDSKAKLYTDKNGQHVITGLSKDSKCYLYFDKSLCNGSACKNILENLKINNNIPDFTIPATEDEGIYLTDDPTYGKNAKSYYWRGAVTNNYVMFANYCWRIIRINGDGSIRLIYDGNVCHENGITGEVAKSNQKYNANSNRSEYVGWTYEIDNQRPTNIANETSSNLKIQTEAWFENISQQNKVKITKGFFCNDRRTKNDELWRSTGTTQQYAGYSRIHGISKIPSLDCETKDTYKLNVGLITADEVQFAGASGEKENMSYYLYNGQYYWTMTPLNLTSVNKDTAYMFIVYSWNGSIGTNGGATSNTYGIRPVINIKNDTSFTYNSKATKGTIKDPYIVK